MIGAVAIGVLLAVLLVAAALRLTFAWWDEQEQAPPPRVRVVLPRQRGRHHGLRMREDAD